MKKLICITLTIVLLFTTAFAFTDTNGHWAQDEIEKWSNSGIINGDGENFHPDEHITRGDFAVIIQRIMNYYPAAENTFSDLSENYYTQPLLCLSRAGVIGGFDGRIRPDDNITRQEAVVIISKAFNINGEDNFNIQFDDSDNIEDWALPYMAAMVNKGYLKGNNNCLNPTAFITRAETVMLIDNITDGLLTKAEYTDLTRDKLTIITGDTVIKGSIFNGNVISVNGAKVHFINCKINGILIAQSPQLASVKLENSTFESLDAKNEYTVEIIKTEITEEPVIIPEKEPENTTDEIIDEGANDVVDDQPVIEDDTAGEVTFCIETFTVGGGYIIAPVKAKIYEGENVAYILDRLVTENGLTYMSTGELDSGFYLSHIGNLTTSFELPDVIIEKLTEQEYDITYSTITENTLGEFDFTGRSGWMYCVNNEFPDVGMNDYYPEDGSVIRIIFTTAYGSDVGGNNYAEYDHAQDFFERVNRDELTRVIAERGLDAFADFMDIITNPATTQAEIDSIL